MKPETQPWMDKFLTEWQSTHPSCEGFGASGDGTWWQMSRAKLIELLIAAHAPQQWIPVRSGSAAYYAQENAVSNASDAILRRVTEAAIRLAILRHNLTQDEDDADADAIIADVLAVERGEDTGCSEPDEIDETNCELLFIENQLRALAAPPVPDTPGEQTEKFFHECCIDTPHSVCKCGWCGKLFDGEAGETCDHCAPRVPQGEEKK